MSHRQVLLNPGPVTLSDRVRSALTRGDWCHREPEFAELMRDINARLARVYSGMKGSFEAATLTGSGTSAVEGMLHSFAPREAATLVVSNGIYGERIASMLAAQGKAHWNTKGSWLEPIDMGRVEALLDDVAQQLERAPIGPLDVVDDHRDGGRDRQDDSRALCHPTSGLT